MIDKSVATFSEPALIGLDPSRCPCGYYCPAGCDTPKQCDRGFKCPAGSTIQTKCTAGKYCPNASFPLANRQCPSNQCEPPSEDSECLTKYTETCFGKCSPSNGRCNCGAQASSCQGNGFQSDSEHKCTKKDDFNNDDGDKTGTSICPWKGKGFRVYCKFAGGCDPSKNHCFGVTDCARGNCPSDSKGVLCIDYLKSSDYTDDRNTGRSFKVCRRSGFNGDRFVANCTKDPSWTVSACPMELPCPCGSYCPAGTVEPRPCDGGQLCSANSADSSICPKGFYCPPRTCEAIKCPCGNYCPAGSSKPIPCTAGYLCP